MPSIFITGANRGLGLEFARQYRADGWDVVAACRHPTEVLNALGVEVHVLDVTDPRQSQALAQGALSGRAFDVLLNNAGIYGGHQTFGDIDAAEWKDVFATNTIGPLKVAEAFLPHVAGSKMKVMAFITSMMGSVGTNQSGGAYIYRSSKAALNAAVKSLAIDLKGKVAAVLLHPGWVKTDMGGAGADITPEESVRGLRKVIGAVAMKESGAFLDYRGRPVPW